MPQPGAEGGRVQRAQLWSSLGEQGDRAGGGRGQVLSPSPCRFSLLVSWGSCAWCVGPASVLGPLGVGIWTPELLT